MKIINVGLLGYGMAGQVFHAPIINCVSGFNIKSIRTTNPFWSKQALERYPQVEIVDHSDMIIEDPKIDLIIVVTLILAAAARINDQRVDSTISKVGAIPSGVSQRVRDARVNEILDLVVKDIVEELTEQLGSASPQRTYALLEWRRQTALPIVLRRAIRD